VDFHQANLGLILLARVWVVGGSRMGIRPKFLQCTTKVSVYAWAPASLCNNGMHDVKSLIFLLMNALLQAKYRILLIIPKLVRARKHR